MLISRHPVRVNGTRISAGIRVLEDRDDIIVGNTHFFYSAQSFPVVEPFDPGSPDGEQPLCNVCGDAVKDGDLCVRCPRCGSYYHQSEERGCWLSRSTCATYGCGSATDLDERGLWIPEDAERAL